jgi:diacylglycerol kinase
VLLVVELLNTVIEEIMIIDERNREGTNKKGCFCAAY